MASEDIRTAVQEKYGEIARTVGKAGCCGPTNCGCGDPTSSNLYSGAKTSGLPKKRSLCRSAAATQPP